VGVVVGASVGNSIADTVTVSVGRSSAICVGASIDVSCGPSGPGSASAGSTKYARAAITPSAATIAAPVDVICFTRDCVRLRPWDGGTLNTFRSVGPIPDPYNAAALWGGFLLLQEIA
jgi:hypothetical protein